jgi:hypothetical protein
MDFVNDVDLIASLDRGVTDLLDEVADLIDPVIGGGVDLDDIRMGSVGQLDAVLALAALVADAGFAVKSFGEKARHRGFPGAAGSAEEIGVGDFIVIDRVAQSPHDGVLPGDFFESLGAVFVV